MPSKEDFKVYFYAKHYALTLRSHKWVVIDGQSDAIAGACHRLYDKILDESIQGGGVLMFSEKRGYTLEELFALAQFKDFSLAKQAWEILVKEELVKIRKKGAILIVDREMKFGNETGKSIRDKFYRDKKSKGKGALKGLEKAPSEPFPLLNNSCLLSVFKNFKLIHEREGIEKFWERYPKKKNPEAVIDWWVKNQLTNDDAEAVCIALERDIKSENWQKDTGRFIPAPDTWLLLHRWTDADLEAYYRQKEKAGQGGEK